MKKKWLSDSNFQKILNSIDDGIFISDPNGDILMVNKAVEKTGNKSMDELVGANIDDLVEEGYCDEFVTRKVINTNEKQTIIQKLKGGREFIVTGIPCFENGKLNMVVACERDITELNVLQTKLIEAENLKSQYESELKKIKEQEAKENKFIIASKCMEKTIALASKLAKTDSTVLIQGESGTGKEEIADYIFRNSLRKDMPYVKLNCGAIPENLLESEMFGYIGGAFTGALKEGKKGYFETANGGTIFLDEVGELPLNLQVKLLRVIQEKKLTPLGGTDSIDLDLRIIVATNRKLKEMIKENKFRQDLYYRLSVTTINIPPLRERTEDVIELSKLFLDKYNNKYKLKRRLSPQAMKLLLSYAWPGNVRELENLLESVVITSEEDLITGETIETYLFDETTYKENLVLEGNTLSDMINEYEKTILTNSYEKLKSSEMMARELGTTRSTINRKLKKYNIR